MLLTSGQYTELQLRSKLLELDTAVSCMKRYDQLMGIGGRQVRVTGLLLPQPSSAIQCSRLDGDYTQLPQMFNNRAVYTKTSDSTIALWWSDTEFKSAWCIGPEHKIGTDKMWAYMEIQNSCPLLDQEGGMVDSWRVYSYHSASWEEQSNVEVLNLNVYMEDVSDGSMLQGDKELEELPRPASEPELALEWDDEDSATWTNITYSEPASPVLNDFERSKKSFETAILGDEFLVEQLSATLSKALERLEMVRADQKLDQETKSNKISQLNTGIKSCKNQVVAIKLRKAVMGIRKAMRSFEHHIFHHLDDWVDIPEAERKGTLRSMLHAQEGYEKHWEDLLQIETKDIHIVRSQVMQEEAAILEEIEFRIDKSNEAMEKELQEMQDSIDRLQLLTDTAQHSHRTSLRQDLYREASNTASEIKDKLRDMASHVRAQSRTIGWLEFELGDEQGRLEYVGQLLREDHHEEGDGVEDGLGVMNWVDGSSYAGEFEYGHVQGIGIETYSDGSTYKGQFEKGHRHGIGVYSTPTADQYSGGWQDGERHGLGFYTLASCGHGMSVLGSFCNGELERRVYDPAIGRSLKQSIKSVLCDARDAGHLASSLAPKIQTRATEMFDAMFARHQIEAYFYAALCGPLLCDADNPVVSYALSPAEAASGVLEMCMEASIRSPRQDPIAESRPSSSRSRAPSITESARSMIGRLVEQTLEVSIETGAFGMQRSSEGASSRNSTAGGRNEQSANVEATVLKMMKSDYSTLAKMLPLLEDAEQFHALAFECGMNSEQSAQLWNAMGQLKLEMFPLKEAHGMDQVKQLFQEFCDVRDLQDRPSMSIRGLELALESMNVTVQLQRHLSTQHSSTCVCVCVCAYERAWKRRLHHS